MNRTDAFRPLTEADRRQAISLTQVALTRVAWAVGDDVVFEPSDRRIRDLLRQFPTLQDDVAVLEFVERHFSDFDVREGLGVNIDNAPLRFARLHRFNRALRSSPKRGLRFG